MAERVIAGIGDTVAVTRETLGALDTDTGAYTPTEETVYTGYGRLRRVGGNEPNVGDAQLPVDCTTVHLPLGTDGVQAGDIIEFTGSRDPALVGRKFVVTDIPAFSAGTSLNLTVSELLVPATVGTDLYVDVYEDVY